MIYMMGMKHSGKTTVGRFAAKALSAAFIDLDDVILSIVGREGKPGIFDSCRAVYKTFGGEYFRRTEALAARETAAGSQDGTIVCALGGGTIENTEARKHLEGTGLFVYLEESREVLYRRISAGGIPAFLDREDPYEDFIRLCEKREKHYAEAADITIRGLGRRAEEIAGEAVRRIREAHHGS